jgi:hypothetical protein
LNYKQKHANQSFLASSQAAGLELLLKWRLAMHPEGPHLPEWYLLANQLNIDQLIDELTLLFQQTLKSFKH